MIKVEMCVYVRWFATENLEERKNVKSVLAILSFISEAEVLKLEQMWKYHQENMLK